MTRLRSASAWQANQHELERAENHRFETRSFPNIAATYRGFTFYLADPISSIHG
jgi:hypothetical protein